MKKQVEYAGSKEKKGIKVSAGEWVILKDDKVIAHDKDIAKILRMADKYKPGEIVISKEPSSKFCFY